MSTTPQSRRPDNWLKYLQATTTLFLSLTIIAVGLWVVFTILGISGNGGSAMNPVIETSADNVGVSVTSSDPKVEATDTVSVSPADPSVMQRIWYFLTYLPSMALAIAFLTMLRQAIRHARSNDPFAPVMVRRLRWIGATLIVGSAAAAAIESLAHTVLLNSVRTEGFEINLEYPVAWVIGGLAIFAIADIMKRGISMRQDLDGLV